MAATPLSDTHRVVLANLAQQYDAWVESARRAAALDFVFQNKRLARSHADTEPTHYEYLYRMTNAGKGLGNSVGRRTRELDAMAQRQRQLKIEALAVERERHNQLANLCRQLTRCSSP